MTATVFPDLVAPVYSKALATFSRHWRIPT
jgi:hypothetical protein